MLCVYRAAALIQHDSHTEVQGGLYYVASCLVNLEGLFSYDVHLFLLCALLNVYSLYAFLKSVF